MTAWLPSPGRPLILGHRGASAHAPENSTAALARAAADGADGVEFDVLCCATGEVVVFHDDDLVRLGGRRDRIRAMPFAAVRAVRLASGAAIPTLEEAIEAATPALLLNIELKTESLFDRHVGRLVDAVARILDAGSPSLRERVLLSSFHPRAVALAQRRLPKVRAGLLFETQVPWPLRADRLLGRLRPSAAHPEDPLCTPAAVAGWHARGFLVNTWTVDDPARIRALAAMGVDGIISNDPAAARAALKTAARA